MSKIVYVRDVSTDELELLEKFKSMKKEKSESKAMKLLITDYFKILNDLQQARNECQSLRYENEKLINSTANTKEVLTGLKKILKNL